MGWCFCLCGVESFQPGLRVEPHEGLARLREERLCIVGPSLAVEPLGVFEQGDSVVEGEPVLGEDGLGLSVVAVDVAVVPAAGGETGMEAVAVGLEGSGELARLEGVGEGEQLVGSRLVVELERGFEFTISASAQ